MACPPARRCYSFVALPFGALAAHPLLEDWAHSGERLSRMFGMTYVVPARDCGCTGVRGCVAAIIAGMSVGTDEMA